jgi:energy-coupling factor transporter ATP-binding protein EcfA2
MPRKTYGHQVKTRVKRLFEALLDFANWEFDECDLKTQVNWQAEDSANPKLIVRTTLADLYWLTKKDKYPSELTKPQIREALNILKDFLKILEDNRTQTQGVDTWHFTLRLWSKDKEKNLQQFEKAWEDSRPDKSKKLEAAFEKAPLTPQFWGEQDQTTSVLPPKVGGAGGGIDWQNVCRTMLEKQKQLTTNRLMRADEMLFDIDRIRVDLALVERKETDKRSEDDNPERSHLYKPDYEETQKLEYKDFLTKVLKSEPSKKIAIIGEPGAGKTTLLQRIAFWILDNTDDLPIWIPLGNFPNPAPKFKDYLLNDWLEDAIPSVTPKVKDEFEELLMAGKVWLLLDGVDEMAAKSGSPLTVIANRIVGWCDRLRVVLTCRLNVWEANPYSLNGFQTYRTLEFSEQKVEEFINACFQNRRGATPCAPELGIQLQQALNQPGKERIKDLVRNPLRLTLLCSTWHLREGKLPDTKAELYQQFVEEVYRWQDKEKEVSTITPEEREQLNAKLKELAVAAIDNETNRFCLRQKFVEGVFGDSSLFQLALEVGWLNQVGVDAKNPHQPVYAFFHPTFQEYFAALAIKDWNFFLNHVPHNPAQGIYRIFEPQWKEVILLWLGRPHEEVDKEQKEAFIKKLVEFEDGCGRFYSYRAYFLAAFGIAEFRGCERVDEIIEHLITWKFSAVNSENSQLRTLPLIAKEAEVALSQTHRQKVIDVLTRRLNSNLSKGNSLQVAEILVQIAPGNPLAIKVIVDYLERSKESLNKSKIINLHRINTIGNLKKFAAGNPIAIAALDKLSPNSQQNNQTPSRFDYSLLKLPTGNLNDRRNFINLMAEIDVVNIEQAISKLNDIDILVGLLGRKPTLKTSINELENLKALLEVLDRLDTNQNQLIFGLIQSINSLAVNRLAEIASNNSAFVPILVNILNTSEDRDILQQVTCVLGKAASRNIDATTAVVRLLQTTEEQIIALDAIYFLKTVIKSGLLTVVVEGLKDYIEDTESYDILYEIFWHCAQNMTYPAFYQAWHQQEGVGKTTMSDRQSLNQADLPQSLQSAITNDPQLSQTIYLICIDGSQFIDPHRPAAEIYDQMLDQNCPECDSVPETMPALKLYWNSLKRKSDKRVVLVFYTSSTDATPDEGTTLSCPYSEAFLTVLTKFGKAICVITEQQFEHIPLKFFSPSQTIEDVVEWIRAKVVEA